MLVRRIAMSFALGFALAGFILVPGLTTPTTQAQGPDEKAAACTALFKQKWMPKGNCATDPNIHFLGTLDNKALVIKTNANERMRIMGNGNIGIGTSQPSSLVSIIKGNAAHPNVFQIPTALKIGTPMGTIPLAIRQNAAEEATPALAFFETSNGGLGSIGANTNALVLGGAAGKGVALNVNTSTRAVTVKPDGKVGIGTTEPYSLLTVKGGDTSAGTVIFSATNATNANLFSVYGNGEIALGHLLNSPVSRHVCLNGNVLSECTANAQYVPSLDGGSGYPETAELVSLVSTVQNPYGDTQAPYTVQKSTSACDANLLGVIVNPELGADGQQKNEHYLPLALTGNHPVKVTMENGFIRRGDALTSSSKPGYAMKATDACKVIGYALEDANAEGQIQVFADLGENAAGQVAALKGRVNELERENAALGSQMQELTTQNASLEARLAGLERALQVQTQTTYNQSAAVATTR